MDTSPATGKGAVAKGRGKLTPSVSEAIPLVDLPMEEGEGTLIGPPGAQGGLLSTSQGVGQIDEGREEEEWARSSSTSTGPQEKDAGEKQARLLSSGRQDKETVGERETPQEQELGEGEDTGSDRARRDRERRRGSHSHSPLLRDSVHWSYSLGSHAERHSWHHSDHHSRECHLSGHRSAECHSGHH